MQTTLMPSPTMLRPHFNAQKQLDYSILIATLFQDLLGDAEYSDVPEKYRIDFNGVKRLNLKGEMAYVSTVNRWIRSTSRTTKRNQYKSALDKHTMYTLEVDHPFVMMPIGAVYFASVTENGDKYTSCSIALHEWSNIARMWTYDGHHEAYARQTIEHIIEKYIAFEWRRRKSFKVTRKLI